MLEQDFFDGLLAFFIVLGQFDEGFRAAVAVAAVVVEYAAPHRFIGRILVGFSQCGGHVKATGVDIFLVLRVHELSHLLGCIFGMGGDAMAIADDGEFFRGCPGVLGRRDVRKVAHAIQHLQLTLPGTRGIDDRVGRCGRLRQSGQHRGFGDGQILHRFAEVGACRAAEAVGTLAEINLVHVQLEDLVFRQRFFDLEREHDFVDLARVGFFPAQKERARYLHGDGGSALRAAVAQVRETGAQYAGVIHAAMLIEVIVLDRNEGLFHDRRHLADWHEVAVFLAEFADQYLVGGKDAQRNLGLIIGQAVH